MSADNNKSETSVHIALTNLLKAISDREFHHNEKFSRGILKACEEAEDILEIGFVPQKEETGADGAASASASKSDGSKLAPVFQFPCHMLPISAAILAKKSRVAFADLIEHGTLNDSNARARHGFLIIDGGNTFPMKEFA